MTTSCLSAQEYQDFLLASLIHVDPCAHQMIGDQIPFLWNLARLSSGCNKELQYLMTRKEILKLLMGCYSRQVDTTREYGEDRNRGFATSRLDGWSQSQQTSQNTSFAESIGKQKFDDLSNSKMRSVSTLLAESSSRDESHGFRDDIGKGYSAVSSWSDIEVDSTRSDQNYGSSYTRMSDSTQNSGCDYQYSESETVAGSGQADASGSFIFVSTGVKAGASYWQNRSIWSAKVQDQGRKDGRQTVDEKTYKVMTARKQSDETGGRKSTSYFNALADDQTHARGADQFKSTGRGNRNAESHSTGAGSSISKAESEAQGSSQRTSQAHSDGESHRESNRNGFSTSDSIAYHQRFEHLRQMYDNTMALLENERQHARASIKPLFGKLLLQNPDGCCEYRGCRTC